MHALFAALLLSAPAPATAAAPDLRNQKAWGEAEKREFLKHLRSGKQPVVTGTVKDMPQEEVRSRTVRKARFLSVAGFTDTLASDAGGKVIAESTRLGGRVLVGGHLFSWVRYYTGVGYSNAGLRKVGGGRESVGHVQIPLGIELALVPLGTPQTRYVLLRGGVTVHHFGKTADPAALERPIEGWQGSWTAGLGYEWQIGGTPWRFNLLGEIYKSFVLEDSPQFLGGGLSTGFVYTF